MTQEDDERAREELAAELVAAYAECMASTMATVQAALLRILGPEHPTAEMEVVMHVEAVRDELDTLRTWVGVK